MTRHNKDARRNEQLIDWVSELVNSQGLMSDGPGGGQRDEGWKCPRLEYTGFRTREPVVWRRVFYRSTKRTALYADKL